MARPAKLTPETQSRICEALAGGNTREHAAKYGGIDFTTFCRWMARGAREEEGDYCQFRHAVKNAEADAVIEAVKVIAKAAKGGTWQAAAWWLERRFPQHYGQQRDLIREFGKRLLEIEKRVPPGNAAQTEKGRATGGEDGRPEPDAVSP